MNQEKRQCQNCHKDFTIEPDDSTFYEKMRVPPPTRCPECRYRRRLLDRNEWSLYRRKCDATGESIISIYRPDVPFPVYKQEVWRSDSWNPAVYGRAYDFSRPFFGQYNDLRNAVPHMALVNSNSVNSEYSNQSQDNKDCYMVSATGGSEKCMYGNWFQPGSYFSADCYMIEKSELCYECVNCGRCHSCVWSEDCFDCTAMSFSIDCRGCGNCFGSVGLRNKNYCWFNEQLSKEEYEKKMAGFSWKRGDIAKVLEEVKALSFRMPRKYYHGAKAYRSTGDYLENTENTRSSFNCRDNKDTAYLEDSWQMADTLDSTEILQAELGYELQGCAYMRNCIAVRSSWTMTDCAYCDMCFSCNNCFGCFGLRQKEYCILNKQYSKDEYLALKEKIIEHMTKNGEWGEYFPPETSPFAYNESVAQDFFPLTKEETEKQNLPWYEEKEKKYDITVLAKDLPDAIAAVDDSILNQVIECSSQESEESRKKYSGCATAFRITPLELELYRKLKMPLPTKCFPCRRTDRFAKRNPRKLWHRSCMCDKADHGHAGRCPNEFETAYAPERPEIIYCESCYQKEVV